MGVWDQDQLQSYDSHSLINSVKQVARKNEETGLHVYLNCHPPPLPQPVPPRCPRPNPSS